MGISGKSLKKCNEHLARCGNLDKKHGDVEVAFALNLQPLQDPACKLRIEQVLAWIKLYENTAQVRRQLFQTAWRLTWIKLSAVFKRPWQLVKGPMAAAQMVLFELGGMPPVSTTGVTGTGLAVQLCYADRSAKPS